jgi:hypothetical protein
MRRAFYKDFPMFFRTRFVFLFLLLFVLALGCGSPATNTPCSVSGNVTFKNERLPGGYVIFHPVSGPQVKMEISPDGTYRGTDLATGDMLVTVDTEYLNPGKKSKEYTGPKGEKMKGSPMPGQKEGPKAADRYRKIPPNYSDKNKSGLQINLHPGLQTFNIELKE